MNSREDKYYDNVSSVGSRTARNNQLYKDINKTELDNFEVKSNATVIGANKGNIDVEKIKSILDTHYNDAPKRRSIKLEEPEEMPKAQPKEETKEYDINVILDKAKENKPEDYAEERAKKIRDTQFDILSNLNIDPDDYIEDYEDDHKKEDVSKSGASDDLQQLIDTIALNEEDIKKERHKYEEKGSKKPVKEEKDIFAIDDDTEEIDTDPLDIFEELKGDENTTVLEGLQEKAEALIDEMEEVERENKDKVKDKPEVKTEHKNMEKTTSLDDSFFTKSTNFKKNDFEEYEEFKDIDKPTSPIVKIIIAILVIIFIAGVAILVKSFL